MKRFIPALAAATLAIAASFAFAQGGPGYGPGGMGGPGYGPGMGGQGTGPGGGQGTGPGGGYGPGQGMGRQGMNPEQREQMRAAYETCKDKPNRQACMSEQVCAKATDPAKCQAQAKERHGLMAKRMEERQAMHEACNGKRGDELTGCLQTQHQAQRNRRVEERQKAHEACNGKRGDELQKCLGEQRGKAGYGRGPISRS